MKKLLQSKIFWTQIISSILGVLAIATPDFLHDLGFTSENTGKILGIIGGINTVLTIIFRALQPPKEQNTNGN